MARALWLLLSVALLGWRPSLGLPHEDPGAAGDPALGVDPAPAVLRIHVDLATDEDLASVALIEGDVGAQSLRALVSGDLSDALAKRVVPSAIWRAPNGETVIAPEVSLEPGGTYSVAAPPTSLRFHVSK